jgi:hypothetical protein
VDRAGVWVMTESDVNGTPAHLVRIDPSGGRITAGTISQRESGAGGVIKRLAGRSDLEAGENGLAADARGAWVVSPARGAILRVEAGRVVRRIPVDPGIGPVLARSAGALWVTTGTERPARYWLARIDEDTGAVTASLGIGTERPKALVPTSSGLWVIGSAGTAQLVGTG